MWLMWYEQQLQDEQDREDVHQWMHRFPLTLNDLQQRIRNETKRDPRCDAGRERHRQDHEESGKGFVKVVPADMLDIAQHETAHNDERRCSNGRYSRHRANERAEECRNHE